MPDRSAAFDHLIHWVHDLDAARASYDAAGLRPGPPSPCGACGGFRRPARGWARSRSSL